jgi:hypothetical protein
MKCFISGNNNNAISNKYTKDPFIRSELKGIVKNAELMGINLRNPEILNGFLSDMVGTVKEFAQGVFNKGSAAATTIPTVTLMTDRGTTTLGPGSISYVTNKPIQTVTTTQGGGLTTIQSASTSMLDVVKQNPLIIAAAVGIPLILILTQKKKR